MKRHILFAIALCCVFGQLANATISIFVDNISTSVPAATTAVSVPVKLFSDTAVDINGYSVPLDYEPLAGTGFGITDPTAVTLIEAFDFQFGVLTSDLVVSDSVLLNNGPLSVAANETVTLFNINFNVAPSADPNTIVPIVLAPDAMGVGSLYSVNVDGQANPIQPAFTAGSVSTVPEPSQLILGFLMAGLATVSIKKRIRSRSK